MSITDRQRTELHKAAEESMGAQPADTMMALLPPVGWADVATKHDLSALEGRIDLRFDAMEHKLLWAFERGLKDLSTRFFLVVVGLIAGLAAVAVTVAQLVG
jgi:hypothetical protein